MDEQAPRVLDHPGVARVARWGVVAWSVIGVGSILFIIARYVLFPIRIIFPPLVLALIVVFILNPLVSALERRGVPRLLGTLITYLVFGGVVAITMRFLIPIVATQVQEFARSLPSLVSRTRETLGELAQRLGLEAGPQALTRETQQQVIQFLGGLVSFTRGLFHVALVLVLGPILAFYLLVDLPKITRGIQAMIPERRKAEARAVARDLGRAVGGFFRGQLLVALVVGLASSLALWIVGLPYWALVGLISGLFNLVPLIGPFIGGVVAAVVAFTNDAPGHGGLLNLASGWPLALGSAIALTIVQQIDNHIISPNVVARTVRLHPVTVMLALLVGGTLLGLWGMLLAVPVFASAKVLLLHAWDTRVSWPPPRDRPPRVADPPVPPVVAARVPQPRPRPPGWLSGLFRRPLRRPAAGPPPARNESES